MMKHQRLFGANLQVSSLCTSFDNANLDEVGVILVRKPHVADVTGDVCASPNYSAEVNDVNSRATMQNSKNAVIDLVDRCKGIGVGRTAFDTVQSDRLRVSDRQG